MERYGFVYIWFDRKQKRYYIGCHWGREDDGYICSSAWMRKAYKRRQKDFKRRILKTNIQTREETFAEELRWLNLIKDGELKKRYYNIYKIFRSAPVPCHTDATKQKLSTIRKGRFKPDAKGIWYDKGRKKWTAEILIPLPGIYNRKKFMKRFNTEQEAKTALIIMRKYRERVVENPERIIVLLKDIERNKIKGNNGRSRPDARLRHSNGLYHTPWGSYISIPLAKKNAPFRVHHRRIKERCRSNERIITNNVISHTRHDPYLIEGKTYAEIGYGFEPKSKP